jgi:uncharacterized RDD family membrane protein YckC
MGRSTGSWLSGPQAASDDDGGAPTYPGEDLGLPQRGPGSVSPISRRLAAFAIDAVLTDGVTYGLFHQLQPQSLFVLFAMYVIGTSLVAQTPGMAIIGLRIATLDGARFGLGRALLRAFLLCLLIPALFTDRNLRGMHDRAVGAVVVRRG